MESLHSKPSMQTFGRNIWPEFGVWHSILPKPNPVFQWSLAETFGWSFPSVKLWPNYSAIIVHKKIV